MESCSIRGVSKAFDGNPILRGVDLEIPKGTFAVLVGPSGCGKSTLLRLIAGLETVDGGTIHIGDKDVTSAAPRDRDIAMVFQSYALYPHLSVRENLAFGLKLRGTPESAIDASIQEASRVLGLDPLLARLPKQLSGGQRQRVAMGRAIVRRPNLFLFDEPLSNLDAALRSEVRVDIRLLHDRLGATTIYVTHDQVEAMTLADKLWVMNRGKVEQAGPPMEIYERPLTKFVATFLGSPQMNLIDGVVRRDGGELVAEGRGVRVPARPVREGGATIGIRPHDLSVSSEERAIARMRIDVIESLGAEAFAHGTTLTEAGEGGKLIARLTAEEAKRLGKGSVLPFTVPPDKVHLFDVESGAALEPR